eukprot:3281961-Rhodomonas_salina.1
MCGATVAYAAVLRASYAMRGTETEEAGPMLQSPLSCYALARRCAVPRQRQMKLTPPNTIHETALLVQIVLKLRFLGLDSGV